MCHGNGSPGNLGGEYNTWALSDAHARAYAVLLDERSKKIEASLNPDKGEPRPEQNELCLNCHVQPGIMRSERSPRFALTDGVGCESCHGQAEKWLYDHTRKDWREQDASKKRDQGMNETGNLLVRAEVCTTCHIGKGDIEVNHDLIAAGHPRLRFEFSAYLANYPTHWREDLDRKRYPDLEARAWVLGQAVSGEAALRLLAHRANDRPNAIWPELAEHDCYTCHHDLAPSSWRQRQNLPEGARPWTLLPNEWYYAALPVAAGPLDLAPLEAMMTKPRSNRASIQERATKLAEQLGQRQKALAARAVDDPARHDLLSLLETEERRPSRAGWDRDTQLYLGVEALTASSSGEGLAGMRKIVAELFTLLNQAFPVGQGASWDSPRGYDPDAERKLWDLIRQQRRK